MKNINLRIVYFLYFILTLVFFLAIAFLNYTLIIKPPIYDYYNHTYSSLNFLISYGILFVVFGFILISLGLGSILLLAKNLHFRDAGDSAKTIIIILAIFTPLIIGFGSLFVVSYFPEWESRNLENCMFFGGSGCSIQECIFQGRCETLLHNDNNNEETLPYLEP